MQTSAELKQRAILLRKQIKRKFPALIPIYSFFHRKLIWQPYLRRLGPQQVFARFYHEGSWGSEESRSGLGSTLAATSNLRAVLPQLVKQRGIRVLLDIPCGDMNWMRKVEFDLDLYIGADIVAEMVESNNALFAKDCSPPRRFMHLDLTRDPLPRADLILCRDCLIHFSCKAIFEALANIKRSGALYLLTTTFLHRTNVDIETGEFRPINLQAKPFNFPPPLELIEDICEEVPGCEDRRIALWRIADLP
jgi:hypothetical protein